MVDVPFFLPIVWPAIKGRNDLNNTALQKSSKLRSTSAKKDKDRLPRAQGQNLTYGDVEYPR